MRKIVFPITFLLIIGLLAFSIIDDGLDIVSIGQSILFLIPLYGFSYRKRVLNRGFAIGVFIWHVISIVLIMPFVLLGSLFGDGVEGIKAVAIVAIPVILIFYTYIMYLYAFRSSDIWNRGVPA